MKKLIYLLLFISFSVYGQGHDKVYSHFEKSEFNVSLTDKVDIKKHRDRTKKIQKFLDSKVQTKSPEGTFYVTESLIQNVSKDVDWTGTILFTDKNIDVLKIRASLWSHTNLTINTSLVKNPTPDKRLITFQFKNINMQWCRLNNVRLIGSEESLTKKVGAGHTGIFWDSTTDVGGTLSSQGESHRIKIDAFLKGLNTGILISHLSKHNTRSTSNSEHEFVLDAIGCKQLIVFYGGAGSGSTLTFRYQNRQILLRGEENIPLVTLDSDFIIVSNPKLYDPNIGTKFRNRLGIEIIGHSTMIENKRDHNILKEYDWKWYPIKEVKKLIRKQ